MSERSSWLDGGTAAQAWSSTAGRWKGRVVQKVSSWQLRTIDEWALPPRFQPYTQVREMRVGETRQELLPSGRWKQSQQCEKEETVKVTLTSRKTGIVGSSRGDLVSHCTSVPYAWQGEHYQLLHTHFGRTSDIYSTWNAYGCKRGNRGARQSMHQVQAKVPTTSRSGCTNYQAQVTKGTGIIQGCTSEIQRIESVLPKEATSLE